MISVKQSLTGKVNIGKQIVEPNLINLEITPTKEEQLFKHEGVYGYDEVKINPIPNEYIIPNGTLEISENGIKDVTNYSNVDVNIPEKEILLQDKTIEITENGTTNIVADEGYDGLGNVEVITNVAGSGGGVKYSPRHASFYYYPGTELDEELANLDTSKISTMVHMFAYCQSLTKIDVSGFDTSNVTNMNYMFRTCTKLTKLDLSNFDTSNVTSMNYMFAGSNALETLILGENFNSNSLTSTTYMFQNCTKLNTLVVKSKTPLEMKSNSYEFQNCNLISDYYASIYVPDELVETYKNLPVWNTYDIARKIKPLSGWQG